MKVFNEHMGICSFARAENVMGLELLGGEPSEPEDADVIFITTCTVKQDVKEMVLRKIGELSKFGKPMIVSGCLADAYPDDVLNVAPDAILLGTGHLDKIAEMKQHLGKRRIIKIPRKGWKNRMFNVPICEGCTGSCNYCIIKKIRGNLFSYPEEEIEKRIKTGLEMGYTDFTLTGQDVASYGIDRDTNLSTLLKWVVGIEGDFHIFLSMMYPITIKGQIDEFLEVFESEKMAPWFNFTLQSGSNRVLKEMGRKGRVEDFLEVRSRILEKFPDASIWVTFMVGYPTETEEDFEKTLELVRKTEPNFVNIYKFSRMPGTPAYEMKPLKQHIIDERAERLNELYMEIISDKNRKYVGKEMDALMNSEGIAITKEMEIVKTKESWEIGTWKKVKIKGVQGRILIADK